jgi:multiple sugar transport system permease protein
MKGEARVSGGGTQSHAASPGFISAQEHVARRQEILQATDAARLSRAGVGAGRESLAVGQRRDPNARPRWLSIALWIGIGFFALLSAFPYLVMISTALKSNAELAQPAHWIPNAIDWTGIVAAVTNPAIWTYFKNSFIIATGTTAIVLVAGVPAAYVLARHEFHGRKVFLDLILITQMFSPIVLLIPLFRLYREMGLLGTLEGVILAGSAFVLPFSIWLLTGFFRAIPVEIEEAARVDGYSRLAILFRIILPLSIPGLVATAMYAFIIGWNEFIFAVTFLPGSPDAQPISVGVFANIGKWDIDWQRLMFMAMIGTLPVLAIFAAIQKQLDRGFASLVSGDR